MFDTYMDAHALDPQMRRRMSVALVGAMIASAVAITGYAGAERLQITRVGAPSVELDFLMAETVASPLAAPPPPAPAQPVAAAAERPSAHDEDPPPEDRASDILDPTPPRPSTTSTVPTHGKIGVPGAPTGVPTTPTIGIPCIGAHCKIGTPSKPPSLPPTTKPATKMPIDHVRGRARFAPDPPQKDLLATAAGLAQRGGTSIVEFCVGEDGKVDKATTKRSAGDGDVDRICRDTVRRWRFHPPLVDGRPSRMCSEVSFVISFE